MFEATDTSKGPELAPTGMVMLIDVPLQLLMVTAAPFSSTALPPCVAPKPVPEITTWLPGSCEANANKRLFFGGLYQLVVGWR
jgi:hypothetical protein